MNEQELMEFEKAHRAIRDRLLQETDWIVAASKETGRPIHAKWIAYRQALRDITQHTGWPSVFPWPDAPASSYFADDITSVIVAATQSRLDAWAQTRNYDGILSLCTYATSTVPKFKTEGQYGVDARDSTWAKLYEIMAEVEAGTRPMPAGYADIEPNLPALVWPA